jgi:hypothetical protein
VLEVPHKRRMNKLGIEGTYRLLSRLAASCRYDRVNPDAKDRAYSFAVHSPRIILRTDWLATNQIVLQYSHWFTSYLTYVPVGDPPIQMNDASHPPDTDIISLWASMWW